MGSSPLYWLSPPRSFTTAGIFIASPTHTFAPRYCPRPCCIHRFSPHEKHHRDLCFSPVRNTTVTIVSATKETLPPPPGHFHYREGHCSLWDAPMGFKVAGDQRCGLHPFHFSFPLSPIVLATLFGQVSSFSLSTSALLFLCPTGNFTGAGNSIIWYHSKSQSVEAGGPTNTYSFAFTGFDDTVLVPEYMSSD